MARRLVVASLLSGVVLVGAAWSLGGEPAEQAAPGTSAEWSWGGRLPGVSVAKDPLSLETDRSVDAVMALSPQVRAGTARRLVTAGGPDRDLTLIAGQGVDGRTCLTFVTRLGGAEFSCVGEQSGSGAIIRYVRDGGTRVGVVEWTTLVGVARSDVARVTLVTRAGTEQELSLNEWRAFGFSTATESSFPVGLRAYAADGSVVEELPTLP